MFKDIKGDWLKQDRLVLCSCDEKYFNTYFDRFYNSFKNKWQLPIHIHIIDPSQQSLKWLNDKNISHTWCNTDSYDWVTTINKFKIEVPTHNNVDNETVKQWLYEGYTQCQRFVVLGNNMTASQSVIVSDVDAYAQHKPTKKDKKFLFSNTAFSYYKHRTMATFCHFHPKDLKKVKEVAKRIVDTIDKDYFKLGLDQKILKEVYPMEREYQTYTKLDKGWIRHFDVKSDNDKLHHSKCLIYHRKGRRGKIGWTGTT
jgi:hypothetical protein